MAIIKKEQIGIRVTLRFKQKLEKIAEKKGHSLSDFVRYELEKLVENEERKIDREK